MQEVTFSLMSDAEAVSPKTLHENSSARQQQPFNTAIRRE